LPREVLAEYIETRMPAPASTLNARVPLALEAITQRLLHKRPEDRFPDGGALHAALEAALHDATTDWDRPLFSRPPPERPEPAPMNRELRRRNTPSRGSRFPQAGPTPSSSGEGTRARAPN